MYNYQSERLMYGSRNTDLLSFDTIKLVYIYCYTYYHNIKVCIFNINNVLYKRNQDMEYFISRFIYIFDLCIIFL